MESITPFIEWTNKNSGFLGFLIFATTVLLGWISGIFSALRKKPKLEIEILGGPTFCASFDTGRVFEGNLTHRTAIAAYIAITNVGTAPTDIKAIHIGYKSQSQKNPFKWFWLKEITVAKSDFTMKLGDDLKVFPFLIQRNQIKENHIDTYLHEGKRCNGVIYFEQDECWGNFLPKVKNNKMVIKVRIFDVYGKSYSATSIINKVTLDAAKKVCETFGETRESLVKD